MEFLNRLTGGMCNKLSKKRNLGHYYMENGAMLLEKLVAFSNGRYNPIHIYSAKELEVAMCQSEQNQIICEDSLFIMRRGVLRNRHVFIKQFKAGSYCRKLSINDIVVGCQMSSHKNVLKLLGCCLDTEIPVVVYESVSGILLSQWIDQKPLSWKHRLKIAKEMANAIAYLHGAFSRTVIHRDVKCKFVIVDDKECVPKLIDFSLSISIPYGKTHVEGKHVSGTFPFIDPLYASSGKVSEKADVYAFGMCLRALLNGQNPHLDKDENFKSWSERTLEWIYDERIDPSIIEEGVDKEHVIALAELSLSCISMTEEKRPSMTEIGKQLASLHRCVSIN